MTTESKNPAPLDEDEEWFTEEEPDHLIASEAGSEPVNSVGRATLAAKTAIFGRRLSNAEEGEERLPKKFALPVFSSDAISSSAYASEEILIVLASAGASYLAFGPVIALAVGLLFAIFYFRAMTATYRYHRFLRDWKRNPPAPRRSNGYSWSRSSQTWPRPWPWAFAPRHACAYSTKPWATTKKQ